MTAVTAHRGLRPDKRAAILDAARTTFATMGFTRATIDTIAAAADVSTRTIYKHFRNKEELFATVLETSARAVADDYVVSVRAGLEHAATLEDRLRVLADAATKHALGHPEHFAMMGRIAGERDHLPPGALDAWRDAGPRRVERETAAQLRALHEEGLLEIPDTARAVRHLFALTAVDHRPLGEPPPTARAVRAAVDAGIEVFARGYAPRRAAPET